MHKAKFPLNEVDRKSFLETGYLYVEQLYDLKDVAAVQKDVYRLIDLIVKTHEVPIERRSFPEAEFDTGLDILCRDHRPLVGALYEAVKKLPSFVSLIMSSRNRQVSEWLLDSTFIGVANRGFGMRMDHPNEDTYLTQLHQDYPSQLCSPAGLVFCSPLRDVRSDMGPVAVYEGSHKKGILPVEVTSEGSYGLQMHEPTAALEGYVIVCPEVMVGDVVILDMLNVHRSTPNRSDRTRWTMISRYFDFTEATGCSNGWKGGLQEGNSFATLHPDLTFSNEKKVRHDG